jgi:hypothetical protein
MKLTQLNAYFVRYVVGVAPDYHGRKLPDGTTQWGGFPVQEIHHVDTLAEAQGIWFLCPLCFTKNGGSVGTHSVDVTFEGRGAADDQGSHDSTGKPSRWSVSGTCMDDLCLAPSILLAGPGCGWHGFVGNSGVPPGEAA